MVVRLWCLSRSQWIVDCLPYALCYALFQCLILCFWYFTLLFCRAWSMASEQSSIGLMIWRVFAVVGVWMAPGRLWSTFYLSVFCLCCGNLTLISTVPNLQLRYIPHFGWWMHCVELGIDCDSHKLPLSTLAECRAALAVPCFVSPSQKDFNFVASISSSWKHLPSLSPLLPKDQRRMVTIFNGWWQSLWWQTLSSTFENGSRAKDLVVFTAASSRDEDLVVFNDDHNGHAISTW